MIELRNLSKSFVTADGPVDALKHVSLTINDGDIYGIIGMSGAGKSTLVRCINMLERPTDGSVIWDGTDLGALSKKEIQQVRHQITMIFQSFNLLMQRTCLENIMLPLKLIHMPRAQARARAMELLETVGLPDKANAYPAQLSGGQQQRIAIARALATEPKVLLCDEATSALDPKTTHAILELIRDINRKMGITVIVITHQMSVVQEICNRVAILENGSVVEEDLVSQVFSNPKAAATKALVYPDVAKGMERNRPDRAPGIPGQRRHQEAHDRLHGHRLPDRRHHPVGHYPHAGWQGLRQHAAAHSRRAGRAGPCRQISERRAQRDGAGGCRIPVRGTENPGGAA